MLIQIKNEDGLSPVDFASSIGFLEGVNFLRDGLKMNNDDKNEERSFYPVDFTFSVGFLEEVNFLKDGFRMNNGDPGAGTVNKDYPQISNQFWQNQSKRRMEQPMLAAETSSTLVDVSPNVLWNPKTSTLVNVPSETYDTTRPQMLDVELWEAAKIGDMEKLMRE